MMKPFALLLCGTLVASLSTPAAAQPDEAEKIFRDMEKNVLAAKAFEVHFTYQAGKNQTRGRLLVTRDNRVLLKVNGRRRRKPGGAFELVSDGKRVRTRGAKLYVLPSGLPAAQEGGQSDGPTPKRFHDTLGHTVIRGGLWFTSFLMPYLIGEGAEPLTAPDRSKMRVYGFKLVGTEKVGNRQARVVRYRMGEERDREDEGQEMTLWIDGETLLPLKRSFVLKEGGEGMRITETYQVFGLGPKIEAGAFTLPPKAPAPAEPKEPPKRPCLPDR